MWLPARRDIESSWMLIFDSPSRFPLCEFRCVTGGRFKNYEKIVASEHFHDLLA